MRRRKERSLKSTLIIFIAGFGGLFLLVQSGLIERVMGSILAPLALSNASRYAEKRAQVIRHSPECEAFHEQVTEAGKSPNGSGVTTNRINQLIDLARAAGCVEKN